MKWIDQLANFVNTYFNLFVIFIIITPILITIIIFLIGFIFNKIKNRKENQKFEKLVQIKNKEMNKFNAELSFGGLSIRKNNTDRIVSWTVLVEIITTVMGNKFDNKYGDIKETLNSLNSSHLKIKNTVQSYPTAFKSNAIILQMLNEEIKPFINKWNYKVNKSEKIIDIEKEFIKHYNIFHTNLLSKGYLEMLGKQAKLTIDYTKLILENNGIDSEIPANL
ncbi:hypothetical protein NPX79_00875 [Spiroplasma endosymbiont of Anurida maritima]|uniref:hypothetical protein n=1 Tax=Spiroplasma endosymbiont of Anurida maritima TaxID=2967972 RepID=UPI0036D36F64